MPDLFFILLKLRGIVNWEINGLEHRDRVEIEKHLGKSGQGLKFFLKIYNISACSTILKSEGSYRQNGHHQKIHKQ